MDTIHITWSVQAPVQQQSESEQSARPSELIGRDKTNQRSNKELYKKKCRSQSRGCIENIFLKIVNLTKCELEVQTEKHELYTYEYNLNVLQSVYFEVLDYF